MTPETLVIVFGAGGRLGRRFLPVLANEPVTLVGVSRKNKSSVQPRDMHWMQVDVANSDEHPHTLEALTNLAGIHRHIILVDLLLDRASVTTMRISIAAVTSYILRLRERLAQNGQTTSLVAASTTATLAPWLYQTPYGLAKRHQLTRYATSGIRGTAFLLPSLVETNKTEQPGLRWTFAEAARELAAAVMRRSITTDGKPFQLVAPTPPAGRLPTHRSQRRNRFRRAARRLLPVHLSLILGGWNSPHQHREASHHRLAITPSTLRKHLDHHGTPSLLLHRLKRSLGHFVDIVSLEQINGD